MMIATAPYPWTQIEMQIRSVIVRQAELFQEFHANTELVASFSGQAQNVTIVAPTRFRIHATDIRKSAFYGHCEIAYNYAYQVKYFSEAEIIDTAQAINNLLHPFPSRDRYGSAYASLKLDESPLRRILETFSLRYWIFSTDSEQDCNLNINHLSLLANMKTRSVRTSLRKEGLISKTFNPARSHSYQENEDMLCLHVAKQWLARRRGFIPQLTTNRG